MAKLVFTSPGLAVESSQSKGTVVLLLLLVLLLILQNTCGPTNGSWWNHQSHSDFSRNNWIQLGHKGNRWYTSNDAQKTVIEHGAQQSVQNHVGKTNGFGVLSGRNTHLSHSTMLKQWQMVQTYTKIKKISYTGDAKYSLPTICFAEMFVLKHGKLYTNTIWAKKSYWVLVAPPLKVSRHDVIGLKVKSTGKHHRFYFFLP